MKNAITLFSAFIILFGCVQEKEKTIEKNGIKQTQYFNKEGKVYKVDDFENDEVYSTTYLLGNRDSTIYKRDSSISVIKIVRPEVYLSKNYDKKKRLTSIGTLLDLGENGVHDFFPVGAWIFYNNEKLSKFYSFYMDEEGGFLLTQIINYDKNGNRELSKSHYIKVTKENRNILLTLYSCCYEAKELLINGEKIKPVAKNKWYVDEKYLTKDHSITGKIVLNKGKKYSFLVSDQINNLPKLELSDITYFYEEVE
ncbi:MAG: hypothetical protein LBP34_01095 [Flavobacteriaceae bacterium]|jgi:hypothetical protein|nr:hypothetical protein [Flavobacteriaceae bacterium]